jgi:hypothetical protein
MYFSVTADIPNGELNSLELRLCFMLDFDLLVSQEQFESTMSVLSIGNSASFLFICTQVLRFVLFGPSLRLAHPDVAESVETVWYNNYYYYISLCVSLRDIFFSFFPKSYGPHLPIYIMHLMVSC